jgi:Tfp pilus assembly protein FimT
MKFQSRDTTGVTARRRRRAAAGRAFTLVELLIGLILSVMTLGAAVGFTMLATRSFSGTVTQSTLNAQAGYLMEFIQLRARVAIRISLDASGNSLTLSFDDDTSVDSDNDGTAYNDQDHQEEFVVRDSDGQLATTRDNSLIYRPKIGTAGEQVLIPSGIRRLPNRNFFTVTNGSAVLVNFGIVDSYARDYYQAIEIQGTVLPLNRTLSTNFVSVLP